MIKYSIFDPAGNITALVETNVEIRRQPEVADEIMKAHPEVEQVGFVHFEAGRPVPAILRMAGGEFCGNATMSAAALYAIRSGDEAASIRVRASGAPRSLEVRLDRSTDNPFRFGTAIEMPPAISKESISFSTADIKEMLPVVNMGGISHVIIEEKRKMFALKDDLSEAEGAVKKWCCQLGADCLGIMFLSGSDSASVKKGESGQHNYPNSDIIIEAELTPLVFVPASDTVFWEKSCASGSAAVGMYLSEKFGMTLEITMTEPGGILKVKSDVMNAVTWLYGRTELTVQDEL